MLPKITAPQSYTPSPSLDGSNPRKSVLIRGEQSTKTSPAQFESTPKKQGECESESPPQSSSTQAPMKPPPPAQSRRTPEIVDGHLSDEKVTQASVIICGICEKPISKLA